MFIQQIKIQPEHYGTGCGELDAPYVAEETGEVVEKFAGAEAALMDLGG